MNGYIQQAFQRFKSFFLAASTVEPPSQKFGYDEYTDVIMLTKPVIYISVKELIRTHTVSLGYYWDIIGILTISCSCW